MARAYLSRRALLHIDEIDEYSIDRWGERVAERYLADMFAAIRRLEESPNLLQARPGHSVRLQFYCVREHTLVCDVLGDDIYVLAVWHGSTDFTGRLEKLEPQLISEAELMARRIEQQRRS